MCAFDDIAFDGGAFDVCTTTTPSGGGESFGGHAYIDERMWGTRSVEEPQDELVVLLAAYKEYYG